MNQSLSVGLHERALAAVDKAFRDWEVKRDSAAARGDLTSRIPVAFTVALSREAGIQGTSVGREVGRLLGWQVYDNELLEQIALDMGLQSALLRSVDERRRSWLLESIEGFLTAPGKGGRGGQVSESSYVHHLIKTVLGLGAHGECVIVGRGAAFVLPSASTLRVRLVSPLPERIAVLSRNLGLTQPQAAREIQTVDRERSAFVKDHFFKDPADPLNYDLILNASRLGVAQIAELIVAALHSLEANETAKKLIADVHAGGIRIAT